MPSPRLNAWLRILCAVAAGWATLLLLMFLASLLIRWTASLLGVAWIATAQLTLNCLELAAAGFIAGRCNRPSPVTAVVVFAATLTFADFGDSMALNVPWLFRLTRDVLTNPRFLDAWVSTAGTHLLLFGCLIAGAMLSRPPERPVSLAERA